MYCIPHFDPNLTASLAVSDNSKARSQNGTGCDDKTSYRFANRGPGDARDREINDRDIDRFTSNILSQTQKGK